MCFAGHEIRERAEGFEKRYFICPSAAGSRETLRCLANPIEGRPGDPSAAVSGDSNVKIQWLRAGALVAEASLKGLKTDVIALFYQPRVDPSSRSKTSRE